MSTLGKTKTLDINQSDEDIFRDYVANELSGQNQFSAILKTYGRPTNPRVRLPADWLELSQRYFQNIGVNQEAGNFLEIETVEDQKGTHSLKMELASTKNYKIFVKNVKYKSKMGIMQQEASRNLVYKQKKDEEKTVDLNEKLKRIRSHETEILKSNL